MTVLPRKKVHKLCVTKSSVRLSRAEVGSSRITIVASRTIALTSCVAEGRHDCSLEGSCKVQPHWSVVNGAVRGVLQEISLATLSVTPKHPSPPPIPAMAGDEIRL